MILNSSIVIRTKATTRVVGRGSIKLEMQCGSSIEIRRRENVLHIPSLESSLFSVSGMDKGRLKNTFGDAKCTIHKGGQIVASGNMEGSLYDIHAKKVVPLPKGKALVTSPQLWHA